MASHQSRCERSSRAPALGVGFGALRGLCGVLSRFGGGSDLFGQGGYRDRASRCRDSAPPEALTLWGAESFCIFRKKNGSS